MGSNVEKGNTYESRKHFFLFIVVFRSFNVVLDMLCRWHNHLNPGINKEAWTPEEELALMNAHRVHGNRWAEIAKVLPGR